MKKFLAYIRVSTAKQGEEGVSLQEQRDAISRYAQSNKLDIAAWFDEKETAAKRGRPVFNEMLKLLRRGRADGVIIHKIDRGARNLKDWSDLGELIDQGVDVRFANESLDLLSRGGRLSADIQAVVAADYIRNLREETRKGFYGRIKQGLYPLPAPLGYLDRGKAKPKEPHPTKAPLVAKIFELYGMGGHSLDQLVVETHHLGLRNRRGGKVTRNGLSTLLNNPFYVGLIRLRRTGETFPGCHEPLISPSTFKKVQQVLGGRMPLRSHAHDFLFRRLLTCRLCGYSLVGERQKGHIYYRCHTRSCTTKGVREECIEEGFLHMLRRLQMNKREIRYVETAAVNLTRKWKIEHESEKRSHRLRLTQLQQRLARLTDAFVDQVLDKELFQERKQAILLERQNLTEKVASNDRHASSITNRLREFLELAKSAYFTYKAGPLATKRDLLRILTSNREIGGKNLDFTLSLPFALIAKRHHNSNSTPLRDRPRTLTKVVPQLVNWFKQNPAISPTITSNIAKHHSKDRLDGKTGKLVA